VQRLCLGYQQDDQGTRVRFPAEAGDFPHKLLALTGPGTHHVFSVTAAEGLLSRRKAAKQEAGQSPLFSVAVNAYGYTSSPPQAFVAHCLIKHKSNFIV
jgi:hypothetical protein